MQHIFFVGTKINSNLSRYDWPYSVIWFNSNSIGFLGQVFIVSHFSNLIFSFHREISSSLEVVWPCDVEVLINYFICHSRNLANTKIISFIDNVFAILKITQYFVWSSYLCAESPTRPWHPSQLCWKPPFKVSSSAPFAKKTLCL